MARGTNQKFQFLNDSGDRQIDGQSKLPSNWGQKQETNSSDNLPLFHKYRCDLNQTATPWSSSARLHPLALSFLICMCVCACVLAYRKQRLCCHNVVCCSCVHFRRFHARMKQTNEESDRGTEKYFPSIPHVTFHLLHTLEANQHSIKTFVHSFFLSNSSASCVILLPVILCRYFKLYVHTVCVWNIHFPLTNKQPPMAQFKL